MFVTRANDLIKTGKHDLSKGWIFPIIFGPGSISYNSVSGPLEIPPAIPKTWIHNIVVNGPKGIGKSETALQIITGLELLQLEQDFCFAGLSPDQIQLVVDTAHTTPNPHG